MRKRTYSNDPAQYHRTADRMSIPAHRLGYASGMTDVPGIEFPVATTIRDQLYDRIEMSAEELALLNTHPFQRLERIQQLGFASRVWPGARHTRFEHSLGVLFLARKALSHLRTRYGDAVVPLDSARTVAAAALLHDVGHYPFSHAIEELGDPVRPHEVVGRDLITSDPIACVLREQWGVDPDRVAAVIDPHGYELNPPDRMLRALLSGPLDVDKMDYLPRDARACGVPYGGVDTERLISSLEIHEVDGEPRVTVGEKGISPTHSLINARQEMFDNVYWHHTNRACMVMLLRAVQEGLIAGAIAADDLTGLDDAGLLALLSEPRMPEPTRRLCQALIERRIHKRAIEVSARADHLHRQLGALYADPARRRMVEERLDAAVATIVGVPVPRGAILIDIPKPEKWRTDVLVSFRRPPIGFEPVMAWREVAGLADADLKRYEEHRRMIRIVTTAELRAILREHWESVLPAALAG
ncbi:MAG TPA: HD domain-containing protein [Thermomicrobiales bacterium]|nr:HD domain-containing protein [Thermomicrobiales bacterium]